MFVIAIPSSLQFSNGLGLRAKELWAGRSVNSKPTTSRERGIARVSGLTSFLLMERDLFARVGVQGRKVKLHPALKLHVVEDEWERGIE